MSRVHRFPTFEEFSALLEALADELPDVFFEGLNGGVIVSDEAPTHPDSRDEEPLYTLGQYCCDQLGRYIVLYYGSFSRVFRRLSPEALAQVRCAKRCAMNSATIWNRSRGCATWRCKTSWSCTATARGSPAVRSPNAAGCAARDKPAAQKGGEAAAPPAAKRFHTASPKKPARRPERACGQWSALEKAPAHAVPALPLNGPACLLLDLCKRGMI